MRAITHTTQIKESTIWSLLAPCPPHYSWGPLWLLFISFTLWTRWPHTDWLFEVVPVLYQRP